MNAVTSVESRALDLLGAGVSQEQVASALGVTASAISQLMAQEDFSKKVSEARFHNLQKHTVRDNALDEIEDSLIEKVKELSPLIMRPLEAIRALQIINQAKRRGGSVPDHLTPQQKTVSLIMPIEIINRFTIGGDNRVLETGDQQLVTIASSKLKDLVAERVKENGSVKQVGTSRSTSNRITNETFDI